MVDKKPRESQWHSLAVEQVFEDLEANAGGLSQDQVNERLGRHGANRLPEPPRRGALKRLLMQFHNVLIYVLVAAAIITAFLEHWTDTAVILAVVVVNAIIGYVQEGKAEKAMEAIRHMLAPQASVLRDGSRHTVAGEQLVPGDIVLLESGDKVPADLRLITAHGLQVQEAILTGESVPVDKETRAVEVLAAVGDRTGMAFSGTIVTSGQGKGVVVATGGSTEIGRISGMLSSVEMMVTPLVRQMDIFGKWLTLFILLVAAVLLVFGHFVGPYGFAEMFMAVVGLSVAAIPAGLPAVLTVTLAIGVQAMARRNAIVRQLPAIETLGSVSVICSDKTGTLTRNEMTVVSVVTSGRLYTLDGVGYEPRGDIRSDGQVVNGQEDIVLEEIARAAVLCNDASLKQVEDIWQVEGDPMEGALLTFAGKVGLDVRHELAAWSRSDAIPFDARHRFMSTLDHDHEGHAFAFVKGAPEQVLSMCRLQRTECGRQEVLDSDLWHDKAAQVAAMGQRVLAIALRPLEPTHTVLEHGDLQGQLILLGMVGMMDPPRPEAIEAVAECHGAGIQVKMITGDHRETARAIGREIGLRHPDRVLTGAAIDDMSDTELKNSVLDCDIFARTSPEHKLRLVMALQSHGMTVAMTGDGVNDAPALKRADAGIAMGRKGSEAAREASNLVLADDNFASIAAAVREGRTVYDNIKKVISWTLPTNAGEAATIMVALLFGMTLPITPIQILWVNMITAVTLGIALAFEPTEAATMRRPPRPRSEPLLTGALVWHVILVSCLFLAGVFGIYRYAIQSGYSIELARTIALNTLVVMEIFHLFFIRNAHGTSLTWKAVRGTPVVWATVVIIVLAQFAITYLPQLQGVFETRSVSFVDGMIIVGIGVTLFAIIETEKQIRLRLAVTLRNQQDL